MSVLDEILAHKRQEVAASQLARPLAEVQAAAFRNGLPLDFLSALRRTAGARPRLIAEVKRASPSRGLLVKDFNPLRLARSYQQNGASAISVLTDERFFQGSLDHLRRVAGLSPRLPVLRKDFILEPYQVYEARSAGADALLLIVAALDLGKLVELQRLTRELGMAALVEVHDLPELQTALACGASLVGINNRDLRTFVTSLETTRALRPHVPQGVTLVAESGIHTAQDVDRLGEIGVDAVLVGEALVTAPDVAAKVRELALGAPVEEGDVDKRGERREEM
jgi:indole-3-glycerol phosphate synthase